MFRLVVNIAAAALFPLGSLRTPAAEVSVNGHVFTLPEGFVVEQVAGPPLVERPISAAFDERGRLYVTDSSGSNEDVEMQVKTRPHRVVRLEDADRDGVFDRSVVFAQGLMFPEGAMWHAGSLYVAAPPEIWKFTDVDDDGQADRREVWFDGKTLTHCANDLHGPYLGPDGWVYWCKGAYAEQTYERPGRTPLTTSAAHIFRRRLEGGPIDMVMTGGMANPVDVVFTPEGERIFSTTFLVEPQAGLRDGLIHAVYGGVYGQERPQSLDAHPQTGGLMPVLVHLGAAAPCGLERLESTQFGPEFRSNLMTCLFNMQKVTRHVLTPRGASFAVETSDFLVSSQRDFHPTDVLEDADGSLIVLDTGGWYKLCCPTSQLWKPDVLGAIYRIRKEGSHAVADPRGQEVDWADCTDARLCDLLADPRPAVRARATAELAGRGSAVCGALRQILQRSDDPAQRREAVWTLTRIDCPEARDGVRGALDDADPVVRQVALHSVSLHRDARAVPKLLNVLRSGSPPHRRVAAEALGRVGGPDQIGELLAVVPGVDDRELEHALIFAALEIGDADALREGLTHADPAVRRAALIALDQREASDLRSEEVVPLLSEGDESLRAAAWWVIDQHADWSASLTELFAKMLRHEQQDHGDLASRLGRFAATVPIQELLGNLLADPSLPDDARSTVLAAMALASIDHVPAAWHDGLKHELDRGAEDGVLAVLRVLRLQKPGTGMEPFLDSLQGLPGREHLPVETRLRALTVIPPAARRLDDKTLPLLCSHLTSDHPVPVRALAVDALQHVPLTRAQLLAIVDRIPHTGPMELRSLMEVFARSHDERVGLALVAALESCPAVGSLRLDDLHRQLEGFGTNVVQKADPLLQRIARENSELMQKFDRVLALIEAADVRNGQALFHSPKAACAACHTTGYLGGTIGPGLRRIGKIRSERDLLEAILLPSASFVQTFEPVTILTRDGLAYSGLIKEESPHRIVLQLDAEKTQGISVDEIEERSPGTTSIMPAGLDKQFTLQELADLVAFLKVVE